MNEIQPTILAYLLLAPTVLYAGLGVYSILRSRQRISLTFGVLMGLCAMLALTYSYEVSAESMDAKIVWMQVKFLFAPFIPICWLALSMQLVGITHLFRPTIWKLLLIVAVLTPGIALTTQHHELFRHHFTLEPLGSLQILHFQIGPWMRIYTTYWHVVGLMGILVLLSAWRGASPTVRRQIAGMLAAYIIPAALDLLYHLGKTPIDGINLAHVFLVPASLIAAWVVFHHRLLNLAPVARSALFDHMKEGVVVFDNEGRIADLNARAEHFLGVTYLKVLGESLDTLGGPWPTLLKLNPSAARARIDDNSGEPQWVECSIVELFNERKTGVGRLCLLRDVTIAVLREEQALQLIKLDSERQRLREQQELMRDLHDGLGSLSANLGLMAARGMRELEVSAKNRLLEQINQFACELGIELREIMSSLESREFYWGDLAYNLRRFAALMLETTELEWNLNVTGEMPASGMGYSAGISLLRVLREAMNNLVKHANARTVQIRMEFSSESCVIEVQDDGHGFDLDRARSSGRGLKNMRRRIEELGGTMQLNASSRGTRLLFELPLPVKVREAPLLKVDGEQRSS